MTSEVRIQEMAEAGATDEEIRSEILRQADEFFLSVYGENWKHIRAKNFTLTEKEQAAKCAKKRAQAQKSEIEVGSNHVYIVQTVGKRIFKIGISRDPRGRMLGLVSGHPSVKLRLVCVFNLGEKAREVEKELHRFFKDQRLNREWFELTREQLGQAINILEGKVNEQSS